MTCDLEDFKSSKTCYIVYFESEGADGAVGGAHQQSKPVFFDKIRSSSFSSGQTVDLQLDTFRNSLELKLDGTTRRVAHNIDARNIYPYVCFQNLGSATIIESCSQIASQSSLSVINEEERSAGYDNLLWPSDLDDALKTIFKHGSKRILCFAVCSRIFFHV